MLEWRQEYHLEGAEWHKRVFDVQRPGFQLQLIHSSIHQLIHLLGVFFSAPQFPSATSIASP